MIQSIIPVGEIITSAILAIGIAAAIGWEKVIMEKFLVAETARSNTSERLMKSSLWSFKTDRPYRSKYRS